MNINEFEGSELISAYTTEEAPEGVVIGRQGNAVLLAIGDRRLVVSQPRREGAISELFDLSEVPETDLSAYFCGQ